MAEPGELQAATTRALHLYAWELFDKTAAEWLKLHMPHADFLPIMESLKAEVLLQTRQRLGHIIAKNGIDGKAAMSRAVEEVALSAGGYLAESLSLNQLISVRRAPESEEGTEEAKLALVSIDSLREITLINSVTPHRVALLAVVKKREQKERTRCLIEKIIDAEIAAREASIEKQRDDIIPDERDRQTSADRFRESQIMLGYKLQEIPGSSSALIMKIIAGRLDSVAQGIIVRVPDTLEIGRFDEVLRAEEQFHRECVGWGRGISGITSNPLMERLEFWHGEALKKTRGAATDNRTLALIEARPEPTPNASAPIPNLAAWLEDALKRKPITEGQLLKKHEISQNTLSSIRVGHSIQDVTRKKLAKAFDVENFEDIPSN